MTQDEPDPQRIADELTITRNLDTFLALGRDAFAELGRGAIIIEELPLAMTEQHAPTGMRTAFGQASYLALNNPLGWPSGAARLAVESYNPLTEIVLVIITRGTPRVYRASRRTMTHPTA